MSGDVWERLDEVLYNGNPDKCVVYIYRVRPDGKPKTPYYMKCHLVPDLLEMLRDYHVFTSASRNSVTQIGKLDSPSGKPQRASQTISSKRASRPTMTRRLFHYPVSVTKVLSIMPMALC